MKKLIAMVTATFLMLSTVSVFAKPLGIYLFTTNILDNYRNI
ncbi:hypothetical protein [Clostridium simiarum]|nr:hypothetical protein [Clostridium simiarum]